MKRVLTLAVALAAAAGGTAARGQSCLSVADGAGGVTLHCQDGRIGAFRVDPSGAAAGMLGAEAFAGSAALVAPSIGQPGDLPNVAYVAPATPPTAPIPPPDPSPATPVPPLTPQPELTPLQQEYLQDRLLRNDRKSPPPSPSKPSAEAEEAQPPAAR